MMALEAIVEERTEQKKIRLNKENNRKKLSIICTCVYLYNILVNYVGTMVVIESAWMSAPRGKQGSSRQVFEFLRIEGL